MSSWFSFVILIFCNLLYWLALDLPMMLRSPCEVWMCRLKSLLYFKVKPHLGHISKTFWGLGLCLTMCLFNFEGFAAMNSQTVHFKSLRNSVDWKIATCPSMVSTTCVSTQWNDAMCFFRLNSPFKLLSQKLHLIEQLFLVKCFIKLSFVWNRAWQCSHSNFFSPKHFLMWLLLLLDGIFFSQCLQLISLWDCMCVFNFIFPLRVTPHFSQENTSCFSIMCVFSFVLPLLVKSHLSQEKTCSSWSILMCILRFSSEISWKPQMTQAEMVSHHWWLKITDWKCCCSLLKKATLKGKVANMPV